MAKRNLDLHETQEINQVFDALVHRSEKVFLSASRLKTRETCSWQYWCKYHLRLPDGSNDGARRGTVVHAVCEALLNPKHRDKYDEIIAKHSVWGIDYMKRYLNLLFHREGLGATSPKGEDNKQMVEEMILVALSIDFFCENGILEKPEEEFCIENEKPYYKIRGFIDKLAYCPSFIRLVDYKSSAQKFKGKELTNNIQAKMYSLWAKKAKGLSAIAEFLFLRYPKDPIQTFEYSEKELEEFELFLEQRQSEFENFTQEDAMSDMAYDKGYGGEGFSGKLVCGYGTYEGQCKKDGTPYYQCFAKYPFWYYHIFDESGKLKLSVREEDLPNVLDSFSVTDRIECNFYQGCPRFN